MDYKWIKSPHKVYICEAERAFDIILKSRWAGLFKVSLVNIKSHR